jgi:hypothetical protein
MFTWEEAGLLRQMIQVIVWIVICVVLAAMLIALRGPLTTSMRTGYQRLTARTHTETPAR